MDRRDFLKLSAATAVIASSSTTACTTLTKRYNSPAQPVSKNEKLLLKNAKLVDVEHGKLFNETRLLIADGKISGILKDDENVEPDKSLDLEGRYVIPGLINAHCHMTLPGAISISPSALFAYDRQVERNAEECIKHGVTTVRDMLAMGTKLDKLKEKISTGEVVGPEILTNCALYVKGGYGDKMVFWGKDKRIKRVDTPENAREAVKYAFDNGADFIKIFQQPHELMMPSPPLKTMDLKLVAAICDETSKAGKIVAMHQTEHQGYQKAVAGGVHSFEHVVRDYDLTDEEVLAFEKTGAMIIPTLSAAFGLAQKKNGDKYWGKGNMPWMVGVRDKILHRMLDQYLEPEFAAGSKMFLKKYADVSSFDRKHLIPWPDPANFTSAVVQGTSNIMKIYSTSVEFGLGNDGGVPFVFPGALALEMLLLQKAGIKPAAALKMATINNAKLFQMENRIGSIGEGKQADLAVFNKNPLESTKNVWQPHLVLKDGRVVFAKA